jgi:RND family efflux transporter MFP subunit
MFALAVGGVLFGAGARAQAPGVQSLTGLDCMIEPHSVADVSTREEGVIEQILVKRGDVVKRGQVVAKLESGLEKIAFEFAAARAAMQGEVQAGEAKLEYMRRQQQRISELYKDRAVAFNEQDKAETDVRLAETELQVARDNHALMQIERARAAQQLELRSIRSPVDGVIVDILLVPGESVEDRAREIMTIAEVSPLNVEVIFPAELFGAVRVGTQAEISPLIPGAAVRAAEVTVVDRTIDAASATFRVQLQLDNADLAIPGGIRCNVDFVAAPQVAAQ